MSARHMAQVKLINDQWLIITIKDQWLIFIINDEWLIIIIKDFLSYSLTHYFFLKYFVLIQLKTWLSFILGSARNYDAQNAIDFF